MRVPNSLQAFFDSVSILIQENNGVLDENLKRNLIDTKNKYIIIENEAYDRIVFGLDSSTAKRIAVIRNKIIAEIESTFDNYIDSKEID